MFLLWDSTFDDEDFDTLVNPEASIAFRYQEGLLALERLSSRLIVLGHAYKAANVATS